jgi:hypothetical protein
VAESIPPLTLASVGSEDQTAELSAAPMLSPEAAAAAAEILDVPSLEQVLFTPFHPFADDMD